MVRAPHVHEPDRRGPVRRGAGIRASDADRDAALHELGEHLRAGRLDLTELEQRAGLALRARTLGELSGLLADLPPVDGADAHPEEAPSAASRPSALASGAATGVLACGVSLVMAVVTAVVVAGLAGPIYAGRGVGVVLEMLVLASLAGLVGQHRCGGRAGR